MSAEQSSANRRRWLGEVALGLYAGLGAVALATLLAAPVFPPRPYWGLPPPGASPSLTAFLASLVGLALPLATVISALAAWLWLGAMRRAAGPARIAAAAALTVAAVYGAAFTMGHVHSLPPLEQPRLQLLVAVLLGVAALLWLPAPRAWRQPRRSRGALVLLAALPLVPGALQGERLLSWRLAELQSGWHVAALTFPLPPRASDVDDQVHRGVRVIRCVVRETYPSTAVADFYARVLPEQGWSAGGPGARAGVPRGWDESAGRYVAGKRHAGTVYTSGWTGPDGKLGVRLSLSHVAPESAPPDLPVASWPREWLREQQVELVLSWLDPRW